MELFSEISWLNKLFGVVLLVDFVIGLFVGLLRVGIRCFILWGWVEKRDVGVVMNLDVVGLIVVGFFFLI